MRWRKLGVVFRPNGLQDWAVSHAMVPTPFCVSDSVLRIYVTFLDRLGVGRPGYVDLDPDNPLRILGVSERPLFDVGKPGTFDENGAMPTCVVEASPGVHFMYYVGFELGTKIRYRLLTGLAVSRDGGGTFERFRDTPILERSEAELYFRGGPFVLRDRSSFRMWYVAGSQWTMVDGKDLPVYTLKYLESPDGLTWGPRGHPCLEFSGSDEHGFGRPWVVHEGAQFKLYYSIRRRSMKAYRLGYAESPDGLHWNRRDDSLGLDVSKDGWDSQGIMYSAVTTIKGRTYLFYNGNNFGESGFGVAYLESPS